MPSLSLVTVTTVTTGVLDFGFCFPAIAGPARAAAAKTKLRTNIITSLLILPSSLSESKVLHQLGGTPVQPRRFVLGLTLYGEVAQRQ